MKTNFWTWWVYRPQIEELKSGEIKELYMDIDSMWGSVDNPNETKEYIALCKKHKIPLYFRVNCFASVVYKDRYPTYTIDDVIEDIESRIAKYTSLGVHICLDYIRRRGWTEYEPTRADIRRIVRYAYICDKDAKVAIFPFESAFYYNQFYRDFKPLTIMPMVYGNDLWTDIRLIFHKIFFPKSVICIKGFETTKENIKRQLRLVGSERCAIWRWNHYKEIMK